MNEASQPCSQKISVSIPSVIFLPESADGPTPSGSPGSRTSNAGLGRARASRSPARGRSSAWRTTGTCGRSSSASSRSADLSLSLVSRLRRRLPLDGSTLFRQTWRRRATPAGRWYWAHTASALPTSGSDSTGAASWGTPTTADKLGRFGENQTRLAQWPTPNIGDSYSRSLNTWKIPAMGQVRLPAAHPLGDAAGVGLCGGCEDSEGQQAEVSGPRPQGTGFWDGCVWLPCRDGKARPIEPGIEPLAHGVPRRVELLKGYGNAIVPQVAAEFIKACIDSLLGVPKTKNQALGQRAGLGSHLQTVRNSGRSVWQDGRHS